NEVSRSFAGSLEIKPLLTAAGITLKKLVDASNWFVMLSEPGRPVLRTIACAPEHEEFMRGVLVPGEGPGLVAEAIRQRRAVQEQNPVARNEVARRLIRHFGSRSTLAVPLVARDEVLGAVVLDDAQRARVFTEAEMERITAVCPQMARALLAGPP